MNLANLTNLINSTGDYVSAGRPNYRIVLLLLLFMCMGKAFGATEIITREVTGFGSTEELAITDALVEGISQVRGLELSAANSMRSDISKVIKEENGLSSKSLTAKKELEKKIQTRTKGYVKSYEILSVNYDEGRGQWRAVLRVQIPRYKATGQDRSKLKTIAVLPFRSLTGDISSTEDASRLNQKLISELTQARKFRVLDREYMSEFLGEQELLNSGDVPMEESLRLGQRLGADFLVVGTISQFKVDEKEKEVLGTMRTQREATINFDFRVIELATQEVRWSNTFNERFDHRRLRELIPRKAQEDEFQIREALLGHAVHATATELLDVIFPIKVVSVEAGEIYLNQGGIRVKQGEVFDVFTAGRKVVDPDTGLKMRLDGPQVATVKITRVMPKFSLATVVDGDLSQIVEHAICRRSESLVEKGDQAPGKDADKKVDW